MSSPAHTLYLDELIVFAHIGCRPEERLRPQEVRFQVELRFLESPPGCKTDQLTDTICYSDISQLIENICFKKHHQLIEHLGFNIYCALKEFVQNKALVAIAVHKVRPPVERLQGGAKYRCGDFS